MASETPRELITEEEEEAQAKLNIWKYIFGFVEMAVVKCAIELGVPEAIENHGGPMTLSELSSALACAPSQIYRIMRFLTHRKIFKEIPTSQEGCLGYAHTALSRLLMRKGEHSMAAFVLLESSPVMLAPWHALSTRALVNAKSPFEKAHGEDIWSYAEDNLAHSQLFNEAMACDATVAVPAIIENCGKELFDGVDTLVDVGGGNGTTMSLLIKACPWIQGINFDLPYVVAAAPKGEGVENVGGDMFQCVPKADAAFLMWVLHDWGDEECIHILKKCREAIPEDKGKVIIVEAVLEEGKEENKLKDVRLMLDMVMMAHTDTGKERTLREWDYVFKEAGFSHYTVKPIRAVQSVIIAFP